MILDFVQYKNLKAENKRLRGALWKAEHAMRDAVECIDSEEFDEAREILEEISDQLVGSGTSIMMEVEKVER